jgi:hypothetical protein
VDNGHPWSSIKHYNLSEIGAFLVVIVKKEAYEKADRLSQMWLGSNLQQKGLQDVLDQILSITKEKKTKEEIASDVRKNWIKLASFKGHR